MFTTAALAGHAGIQLLAIFILAAIMWFGAAFWPVIVDAMKQDPTMPPELQEMMGSIMGFALGVAMFIIVAEVALGLFAAWGVFKARRWAKPVTVIISVLWLLSFPFGTAVGAYALWFVMGRAGEDWFASAGSTTA